MSLLVAGSPRSDPVRSPWPERSPGPRPAEPASVRIGVEPRLKTPPARPRPARRDRPGPALDGSQARVIRASERPPA